MKLSDFDFDLPERLIATRPAKPRSSARLLVAGPEAETHLHVRDLPEVLRPGDRLVLNNTKVIPARLTGLRRRASAQGDVAAKIEITLLEPTVSGAWRALLKPLKKVAEGERVEIAPGFYATLQGKAEGVAELTFNLQGDAFDAALAQAGSMPLPPYIAAKRAADAADKEDYQTIWADRPGAVAAPTASLHFDAALMEALAVRGVETSFVTLHVGAGTFLPVKTDAVEAHQMHAEWGEVTVQAAAEINATRAAGGRVIAVGTTALRLIETAGRADRTIAPWVGATDIYIYPGYGFKVADGLMTNFHLPKSTLILLVAALMGTERIRALYDAAIARDYRFFSYGDASLFLPGGL